MDARRAGLLAAKLRALVTDGWPEAAHQPRPFPAGAAVVDGPTGWALVDEQTVDADPMDTSDDAAPRLPHGWLGGTVVWASRQGVTELHVIADTMAPTDAARASVLARPPVLWRSVGRSLQRVVATDRPVVEPVDRRLLSLIPVIEAAGADAVVEHGVLRGEVLGLEVARAEFDADGGEPRLVVGVGRHDQLAQAMMHGTADVEAALADAVGAVSGWRRADAAPHPANQLARSRWLRWVLIRRPDLVGASSLAPLAGIEPPRLKVPAPAMMLGEAVDGSPMVVAASVGIDLDAPIVAAVIGREVADGPASVVVVVPEGDAVPALRLVCEQVTPHVELRVVPAGWAALS